MANGKYEIPVDSKSITSDDVLGIVGINLDLQLNDGDNPSNKVGVFLQDVEDEVDTFVEVNFYKSARDLFAKMTDYQKAHYKIALVYQCKFKLDNGDIGGDSGYRPETDTIVKDLPKIMISERARQHLILCGLWNRHIKNRSSLYGGIF